MKTRSSILPKVFGLFLLAVLTLGICFPVTALSGTTTLTTSVPSHFVVDVHITGNGAVTINGTVLSKSGEVKVERNEEVHIQITTGGNYYLKSVTYNGTDITKDIENGSIDLPMLKSDAVLSISFSAKSTPPATGDNSQGLLLLYLTAILSLTAIAILLIGKKRLKANN